MLYDFLLINPWIYDFSAYDFWLRPYGLLYIGGKLRKLGYQIYYLDLLDPFHPKLPKLPKRKEFGIGAFYKEPLPKPVYFKDIPRKFYRYGLPINIFKEILSSLKFKAVLLGSTMTYWYPGLFTLLKFFSENYRNLPLYVGGIYAKLEFGHLKNFVETHLKDTEVHIVNYEVEDFLAFLQGRYEPSGKPYPFDYPIFDLQTQIPYVILFTSFGCPFRCPYCASFRLQPSFIEKSPHQVWEEIIFWKTNYGVKDFAFYDDALLFNFENRLKPILEKIIEEKLEVNFHTPNAIHARFVTKEVATLLKKAGFKTLRLGLERVENRFDNKITLEEFLQAISYLKEVGFSNRELGAYVLYGIPEENWEEVEKTLLFLAKTKVPPHLAEFSPIPKTPFFEKAKLSSRYPLEEDPIFHNNTVFPSFKKPPWEKIQYLKQLSRKIRHSLIGK
ncbi:MAG: radical SAM protein [Thermodesulfobacteriaceae bacterium]|nr:radical SAM protein [Thermodesulfobacteriaceae bacterium]